MDWVEMVIEYFILPGLVVFCVVLMLAIPFMFYWILQDSKSPTFELRKDEWVCMESHEERYSTLLPVGKVMIPQWHTKTVCDSWRKK